MIGRRSFNLRPDRRRPAAVLLSAAVAAVALGMATWLPPAPSAAAGDTPAAEQQLWTCGMHPQVIRHQPGSCPICGMQLVPLKNGPAGAAPAKESERTVLYWWDPMMSPPYISDKPGKSPMGMDLVPVYEDEVAAGASVVIDPVIVQNMGVRIATAAEGPLHKTIRAVGYLNEAEPNQYDVNLRVSGWVERLYADAQGMHLAKGAPLFDLYSPELQVAIEELIAARRARDALTAHAGAAAREAAETVFTTAERKLRLLGLHAADTARLAQLDRAPHAVTFTSPIEGHLIEKPIVDGSAVEKGMRALRIVDHHALWLDAQIYEQQFAFVRLGQPVRATVVAFPGMVFDGTISLIHPHLDPATRAAMVRIVVNNPTLDLHPGMYATVEIEVELTPRTLLVPRAAVIDTGVQQVAFVVRPRGHFDPRTVTMGVLGDDGMVQILAGLAPGEEVVTSGQFLIDAESRFREAIAKFLKKDLLEPGAAPAPPAAAPPGHVH